MTLAVVPEPIPEHHPCTATGCPKPTRLYAGGWRCVEHPARVFVSDILGRARGERP